MARAEDPAGKKMRLRTPPGPGQGMCPGRGLRRDPGPVSRPLSAPRARAGLRAGLPMPALLIVFAVVATLLRGACAGVMGEQCDWSGR